MNKKYKIVALVFVVVLVGFIILFFFIEKENKSLSNVSQDEKHLVGKRVAYVNSYHDGFEWSDGEQMGVENILNESGVVFKSFYMDAKNNPSQGFGEKAALLIKEEIDIYEPDLLIVTDDPAYKYLALAYYKDSSLPVVFGGVNWDLSSYGGRYHNMPGIVEVALYKSMVDELKKYSKGERVGFLTGDNISEYKNADFFKKTVGSDSEIIFVKNFTEWKKNFIEIQKNTDILIIGISAGIEGWDNEEAERFVLENTKIPTGTEQAWMIPFAMIGYAKNPQEQGEVAAQMAIDILSGVSPEDIQIEENKKADIFLNLRIAEKLGLLLDSRLLKKSTVIN